MDRDRAEPSGKGVARRAVAVRAVLISGKRVCSVWDALSSADFVGGEHKWMAFPGKISGGEEKREAGVLDR